MMLYHILRVSKGKEEQLVKSPTPLIAEGIQSIEPEDWKNYEKGQAKDLCKVLREINTTFEKSMDF